MAARLRRIADIRLARYLVASIGALALDIAAFTALLAGGVDAALAAGLGYALGILAHWLLSSRAVFVGDVVARGPGRRRQKALFIASALVGLALTTAIVGGADLAGIHPHPAKLVAIVASFAAVWMLRSRIVFRPRAIA